MTNISVEPAFEAESIQRQVKELAGRLEQDLGSDDAVLLLSLLGDSVIFLADLVRAIHQPLRYEFIMIEQSDRSNQDEPVQIYFPIPVDVKERKILLVKDVVSTGVIETYLTQQLTQLGARDVKVATLVDMPQERKTSFQPDYHVFTVERRGTLVGYGLKHDGDGGNLPFLGWLETP